MAPTLVKHLPGMATDIRHSIDMFLGTCKLSLKSFRVLTSLKAKPGQILYKYGPNLVLAWLQKLDTSLVCPMS